MRISELEQRIQIKASELEDLRKQIPDDLPATDSHMAVAISELRTVCKRLRKLLVEA